MDCASLRSEPRGQGAEVQFATHFRALRCARLNQRVSRDAGVEKIGCKAVRHVAGPDDAQWWPLVLSIALAPKPARHPATAHSRHPRE